MDSYDQIQKSIDLEISNKPWYKSVKKVLGVSFAVSVLIGGIIYMINNPKEAIDVLELWAEMSYIYIGLKVVSGVAGRVTSKKGK